MPVDIKCAQVRDLATNLKENKVEFKKSYLPILGIAAFVTDDYNKLSKNVLDVSETLKKMKDLDQLLWMKKLEILWL